MKRNGVGVLVVVMLGASLSGLAGCKERQADAASEAPPPTKVVADVNVASWAVEDPSKYTLVAAQEYDAPSGHFFRVRVGRVPSPDAAQKLAVQLKNSDGFQTFVMRLDQPSDLGIH